MDKKVTFLVVNCGTSSIKITLFSEHKTALIKGTIKNLFSTPCTLEVNQTKRELPPFDSYTAAIETLLEHFKQEECFTSIAGIGHRIVHGGETYTQSIRITEQVVHDLQELSELAPLHNPIALEGIACSQRLFPDCPQIAVFDTAFHAHIPPKAAFYPIPLELSQKYKIKRYGFHGIAHAFSWQRYAQLHKKKRLLSIHLGSGCSLAAIDSGISIDTTMGFTPLDGLMMATRSGELDPSIVAFLCNKTKQSPEEVIQLLNHQSGLLGIAGTGDIQQILSQPSKEAKLALEMFTYHIQKNIGAFIAALEGIDAISFSGGIGENSWEVRKQILSSLSWYSIFIDEKKNRRCTHIPSGEIHEITLPSSAIPVYVIGSDENLFILEEMLKITKT